MLIQNTDKTSCEVCDYVFSMDTYKANGCAVDFGPCKLYKTIVFCPSCLKKELEAEKKSIAEQNIRVIAERERSAQVTIERSMKIDQSIQIQSDLFNAKTVSIHELKTAIDADPAIENKHFSLARTLEQRFTHLNSVLNELSEKQKDAQTEQRAIQTYYNELSKKLREDERAQIKMRDVQYQPPIKPIKKQKSVTVKKYDKEAVRNVARETGLPEATIQMVVTARQIEPLEILRIFNAMKTGDAEATAKFGKILMG